MEVGEMIWTLIALFVTIVCVAGFAFSNSALSSAITQAERASAADYWRYQEIVQEKRLVAILLGLVMFIAIIILLVVLGKILIAQLPGFQERRLAALYFERKEIYARMKFDQKAFLAAKDFNTKVENERLLRQNPWWSWFHGAYIMNVKLIDFDNIKPAQHAAIQLDYQQYYD